MIFQIKDDHIEEPYKPVTGRGISLILPKRLLIVMLRAMAMPAACGNKVDDCLYLIVITLII